MNIRIYPGRIWGKAIYSGRKDFPRVNFLQGGIFRGYFFSKMNPYYFLKVGNIGFSGLKNKNLHRPRVRDDSLSHNI